VSPVLLPSHDLFEVERLISQRQGSGSRHITIKEGMLITLREREIKGGGVMKYQSELNGEIVE